MVGNLLFKDGIMVTIDARSIFDIWEKSDQYSPVPISKEILLRNNFQYSGGISLNKFEVVKKYVLNNSDDYNKGCFMVCEKTSTYSGGHHFEWLIEMDDDHIGTYYPLEFIHQIQNLFYCIAGKNLIMK